MAATTQFSNTIYNTNPPGDHIALIKASCKPITIPAKPSYGLDSPLGLLLSSIAAPLYLYATLKGKGDAWDKLLAQLPDSSFAQPMLDVGCGRGLVLLKLAQRKAALGPHTGKRAPAYGIDIFRTADQSGNSPQKTYANAASLKIQDNVVLHTASFTETLPFADSSFSLVTSSLAIHNVSGEDRTKAIREIARVCAPGGDVLLLDLLGYVARYKRILRAAGWDHVSSEFAGANVMFGVWPCQILRAKKPQGPS